MWRGSRGRRRAAAGKAGAADFPEVQPDERSSARAQADYREALAFLGLPRRLCRPRHGGRATYRRHTLASETDPRRSHGSGSYTATPTRWPTTRPTAQASTPSPASSRLAVSGFSLVSHVLAAPMTSSVATASDAAIASVGCGA